MMNAAFLIEGRPDRSDVEAVTRDHMVMLPGWDILLFITAHYQYLMPLFEDAPQVKFFLIPDDFVGTYARYNNRLARDHELWEVLSEYDRVLLFQDDSKILRPGIEEFLEWDYVGAPWPVMANTPVTGRVGNGGLSLRNPKKFLEIVTTERHGAEDLSPMSLWYEDKWFASLFKKHGVNVAPVEVAEKFSVEGMFKLGTWGCHAIHKYLPPAQCKEILTQYGIRSIPH